MFNNALSFVVSFFTNLFRWLDEAFIISNGVSYLSILIAAFLVFILVDNFIAKGQ